MSKLEGRLSATLKIAMLGTLIYLPFAALKDYKGTIARTETWKHQQNIDQVVAGMKITSASYQDTNIDGTNELVVADASGRTTTLWRYDNTETGITNQYFSFDEIKDMEIGRLERERQSYTSSPEIPSMQGGTR